MERLTQDDLHRLMSALRELYSVVDLDTFPTRVLSVLPQVVRSDRTGYNEVNPKQRRVAARFEPFSGNTEEVLSRFAQHMHEHPVLRHVERTKDGSAKRISDFLTQRQFHQLGLYRDFFRALGTEHQMSISLPAPAPVVIGIAFNRGRPDFSERERLLLDLLRPHVVQAYQNAEVVTQFKQRHVSAGDEDGAYGIVVLDHHYRVRHWTEQTRRWITEYVGKPRSARRLPDRLERWVMHQRSRLAHDTEVPSPRTPLVIERPTKRLIIRVLSEPIGDQHLVLLEEQCRAAALSLDCLGLTRRESEVLRWVAEGKTNAEIATILNLSPLTIRTHLEHIFRKLGVETRTTAAVRALEMLPYRRAGAAEPHRVVRDGEVDGEATHRLRTSGEARSGGR